MTMTTYIRPILSNISCNFETLNAIQREYCVYHHVDALMGVAGSIHFFSSTLWCSFLINLSSERKSVLSPGRALKHVFNNPYATEGYLSWGYLSKKLEFFTPYKYK